MYRISNVYVSCIYRIYIVLNSGFTAGLQQFYKGLSHILLYVRHIVAADIIGLAVRTIIVPCLLFLLQVGDEAVNLLFRNVLHNNDVRQFAAKMLVVALRQRIFVA